MCESALKNWRPLATGAGTVTCYGDAVYGQECLVECAHGFAIGGGRRGKASTQIVCGQHNTTVVSFFEEPLCEPLVCEAPALPEGTIEGDCKNVTSLAVGEQCARHCVADHAPNGTRTDFGGIVQFGCEDVTDGVWKDATPAASATCDAVPCPGSPKDLAGTLVLNGSFDNEGPSGRAGCNQEGDVPLRSGDLCSMWCDDGWDSQSVTHLACTDGAYLGCFDPDCTEFTPRVACYRIGGNFEEREVVVSSATLALSAASAAAMEADPEAAKRGIAQGIEQHLGVDEVTVTKLTFARRLRATRGRRLQASVVVEFSIDASELPAGDLEQVLGLLGDLSEGIGVDAFLDTLQQAVQEVLPSVTLLGVSVSTPTVVTVLVEIPVTTPPPPPTDLTGVIIGALVLIALLGAAGAARHFRNKRSATYETPVQSYMPEGCGPPPED